MVNDHGVILALQMYRSIIEMSGSILGYSRLMPLECCLS